MAPARKRIVLRVMDAEAKERIRKTFAQLEETLQIDGLGVAITTAILELVENAVKANLKRAFFLRRGFELDEAESYQAGIKAFVDSYGDIHGDDFVRALADLDLVVSVDVDHNRERLLIFVENNTLLLATEEARIRGQLAAAMTMDRLSDFYISYGDETEGSGLGLAMIVFLVRNLGFAPENFRVFRRDKKTIARLEFPLHKDYVPIRKRRGED